LRFFKRIYIVDFLVFALIISTFIAIEVYLHKKNSKGSIAPYQLSNYTHNGDQLWWRWGSVENPNSLKLALAPYTIYKNSPDQRTPFFNTNSLGFRGSKEYSAVCEKQKRIIVVGGSAAFGHGLPNDKESFQSQIEQLNTQYEVINAGVGGFYSGQELTYIVTELVDYHPDLIIAFDGFNDLFWTWYSDRIKGPWHEDRIYGHLDKDNEIGFNLDFFANLESSVVDSYQSRNSILNSFKRFYNTLISRSMILSKVQKRIIKYKKKILANQAVTEKGSADIKKSDYLEKIINTYAKNLIKMNDFSKSQGIKFVAIFQPELGLKKEHTPEERNYLNIWPRGFNIDNYEEEFPQLYKLFLERTKSQLDAHGVQYIDINICPEYLNHPDTLFLDFVHLNKEGNKIIANIISEYLNEAL